MWVTKAEGDEIGEGYWGYIFDDMLILIISYVIECVPNCISSTSIYLM